MNIEKKLFLEGEFLEVNYNILMKASKSIGNLTEKSILHGKAINSLLDIVIQLSRDINHIHPEIDVSHLKTDTQKAIMNIEDMKKDINKFNNLRKSIESTPEKSLKLTTMQAEIKPLKYLCYYFYPGLLFCILGYLLISKLF